MIDLHHWPTPTLFVGKDMYFGNTRPWYVLRCDPPRFVCGLKSLR
jgi:hypothetical protein